MTPHDISKRKLRGGRRYFRRLRRWGETFTVDLAPGHWYDLWHEHPDLFGWSLRGGKARRAHLAALFQAFDRVLEQVRLYEGQFQTFVGICREDSPGDALYFHTPNPNSTNFPHAFPGYRWDARVPPWLAEFVDLERFEFGETQYEDKVWYAVVPRGRGGRLATAARE
jgi:hypothetical protein